LDIHEFLLEKGVRLDGVEGVRYLYHDPCHTPMKLQDPMRTVTALVHPADGSAVLKSDRCCGESGTLAISRPDISTQVRYRKQVELSHNAAQLRNDGAANAIKVLTSCPSCLQGLQRYQDDIDGLDADYIVVEIARQVLGDSWLGDYVARASRGGIERILV
jgi:Fe-S oxidoreductase